jgi:LAS superfamily LD-carboxypeptidase LdcB
VPSTARLHPQFRPFADALLATAKEQDRRFTFTSTFRTRADQVRLYNRWLKGESPFPALPPGRSQHERGLAVDMVRLNVDPETDELLVEMGERWREAGGVWGGAEDPVHFEAPRAWTGR